LEWKYPASPKPSGERPPFWFVDSVTPPAAKFWFKGRLYSIKGWLRGMLTNSSLIDRVGGPMIFPQDRSLQARVAGVSQGNDPDKELTVWEILKELGQQATSPSLEGQAVASELKQHAQMREGRIKSLFGQICAPKQYLGFAYTPTVPLGSPHFQDGAARYSLATASSGEQVILEYITRLTFPNVMNRGVILIDEPEVHLHPGWVRQLYRALPQLGNDNQFIVTTHSAELRSMAAEDGVLIDLGDLEQ
jgi:hypothetical protein